MRIKHMPYYPINLKIAGRSCVVIGGGAVAERKVGSLLTAGAKITVYSPNITPRLAGLVGEGLISHIARPYCYGDLANCFIVICATDNRAVNITAAKEAKAKGALVNVADVPELCDFIVPARVTRGDFLLTVSTNGKSPAFTKKIRQELEQRYGSEYGTYLELISQMRLDIKNQIEVVCDRENVWREQIDIILNLLKAGKLKEAEEQISNAVSCIGNQS